MTKQTKIIITVGLIIGLVSTLVVCNCRKDNEEPFECGEVVGKENGMFILRNYDTGETRSVEPTVKEWFEVNVGNRYCER